jgi:hypothetical protein
MKTKKDINYSFNHVNERLQKRFNLSSLTRKLFDKLSYQFKKDKSTMILLENKDQEIHQITYKKQIITFVFSIKRGYITTALKW